MGNQVRTWFIWFIDPTYGDWASSLCFALVMGFFQSAWALRRPAGDVLRWMAATAIGIFLLALPFRIAANGFPPNRLSTENEVVITALYGLGIGLLQLLMLPKTVHQAWRWIPANGIGALAASLGAMAFASYVTKNLPWVHFMPFFSGALFGCVTAIPLGSILRSEDEESVEGVAQS